MATCIGDSFLPLTGYWLLLGNRRWWFERNEDTKSGKRTMGKQFVMICVLMFHLCVKYKFTKRCIVVSCTKGIVTLDVTLPVQS